MTGNEIDDWELLSATDKIALERLNDTDRDLSPGTVLDQLGAVAAACPESVAVSLDQHRLTYRQLMAAADGVAGQLRARGVTYGDVCAIFMTRRIELYPVLLGIMLAGGVVAPLDLTAPSGRLGRCLELANAKALICDPELRGSTPGLDGAVLEVTELLEPGPAGEASPAGGQSAGAYLVFTSGTTGVPKPVLVGHRALANLVSGLCEVVRADSDSRLTQSAPIHFDAAWQQIFCAWTTGATLLPVPDAVRVDGIRLARWLVRERITHYDSVPSLWYPVVRALADNPELTRPEPEVLLLAGEELRREPVAQWLRDVHPQTRIYNLYGPTEATIDVTYHLCAPPWDARGLPIGRPLPNVRCYVLNNALTPCPVGVGGQLYLGGAALAAGYLGHSRATAMSFLPDPFSPEPGARMYATGDRVRLLPSGELLYEGRLDAMVKVRGVRVDLGDVETALRAVAGVGDAVVVHDQTRDRLVAFLQPAAGPDDQAVYEVLADHLPPAYLPSALIRLDQMPLTVAGKLDRTLLARRALSAEAAGHAPGSAEAATPAQRALAGIWAELLAVPGVGLDDNFFALGGDSIKSIVLRDRAAAQGIHLDVLDVFKCPTVRQLAELTGARAARPPEAAQTDHGGAAASGLGLLPGQDAFFWESVTEPDQTPLTVQESYRLAGPVDPARFEDALNILIERHPALRAELVLDGDTPVHRFADRPRLTVPVVPAGSPSALAELRARRRRELTAGRWPSFDLTLVSLGEERHELIWTMHHALSDGWSHALLREELFALYTEIGRGFFVPLPEQDQYRRLLAEAAARGPATDGPFWAEYLRELRPTRLPRDGKEGQGAARRTVALRLDGPLRQAIAEHAKSTGTSENRVVLAALTGAVQQFTGSGDVTLLYVTSGRGRTAGDTGVVGCLVNTVPLRVAAPRPLEHAALLAAVSEALTRVGPHEDASLGRVLRGTGLGSAQALSDVIFLFQNYPQDSSLFELGTAAGRGFSVEAYEGSEEGRGPLTVICYPEGPDLMIDLDYAPEALSPGAVAALGDLMLDRIAAL